MHRRESSDMDEGRRFVERRLHRNKQRKRELLVVEVP